MKAMKRMFRKGGGNRGRPQGDGGGSNGIFGGGGRNESLRASSHHEEHAVTNDSRSLSSGHHSAPMAQSASFEPESSSSSPSGRPSSNVPAKVSSSRPNRAVSQPAMKTPVNVDTSGRGTRQQTGNGIPETGNRSRKTTMTPSPPSVEQQTYSSEARPKSNDVADDPNESNRNRTVSTPTESNNNGASSTHGGAVSRDNNNNNDRNPIVSSDDDDSLDDDDANKGVSSSFKGLNVTDQFDDGPDVPPADVMGRMASISDAYDAIPLLEQTKLPRGGISIETKAIGRVQFGIPPETIKDSMQLGIPVPQVYIVPAERFCREMGPALGVNLAEFEFPAYFNFFVYKKNCTLIVDSQDAEDNICRVFEETLLGPKHFRRNENPIKFDEEDFAPDFPREAIPDFEKELEYFRVGIQPDKSELTLEKLLSFCHFKQPKDGNCHDNLGVPPNAGPLIDNESVDAMVKEDFDEAIQELRISEDIDASTGPIVRDAIEKEASGETEEGQLTYARARWVGDVATVWPKTATEEEKKNRSVPRVEVFKMPSGTEYIIHDVDENNMIIGRARFSGHVKVSESMGVQGFGGPSILDDTDETNESFNVLNSAVTPRSPPSFYPPSFGVTILGNSSGFDASGSVSGYVLWINGRGVMIDPPPYSSATLEREGIRPRTIVGIILTHTHADHDAGAFQKVLTESQVVVIATPTVYKSFIRKYAALASLSPALLRHSHRYKAAVIGQPLRFQGATFHFFYSLHAIPCVGFRVEWRGRSMVFSGDHMNKPLEIDQLQADGILSKARADDLRNMPLQETDLLLHEAGAPPIHTPLEVLQKLPQRVKKRLYVVHTASIPKEFSDLRVAPTGTAGTLRLDELRRGSNALARVGVSTWMDRSMKKSTKNSRDAYSISLEDDEEAPSHWSSASNEYVAIRETERSVEVELEEEAYHEQRSMENSFAVLHQGGRKATGRSSIVAGRESSVPLVSLRPASSTDAWFILNLLSAVPFLSSLSYSSTMEVLETARVDAYCRGDIVVPASRRKQLLCVIWEGTCIERDKKFQKFQLGESLALIDEEEEKATNDASAVWHAGDWTGPISLQPEKRLSGESEDADQNDIVAISAEGVKVITVEFSALHSILQIGSTLYPKYVERQASHERTFTMEDAFQQGATNSATQKLLVDTMTSLNVLDLIDQNSALRKLSAVQKRHLESLAEGPAAFNPGDRLWRAGAPVDKAILIVAGTASFVTRRRNAGSSSGPSGSLILSTKSVAAQLEASASSIGYVDEMQQDVQQAVQEMGDVADRNSDDGATEADNHFQLETVFSRSSDGRARSMTEAHDFDKLSKTLKKRAESLTSLGTEDVSIGSSHDEDSSMESGHQAHEIKIDDDDAQSETSGPGRRSSLTRRRSSRARFANKVLGRLYSRRAFTGGLVFSRGHFLGDVSKMVAGRLSTDSSAAESHGDQSLPTYGFGDKIQDKKDKETHISDMVIHENDSVIVHTSTLTAGKDGCVVLVFPKSAFIPFLDEYPGLLLSLLGTQVVV